MTRKRSRPSEVQSSIQGQRLNGRACVNCHRRKIRCDILDRGAPCTHCSSRNLSECRLFPKKKTRESIARSNGPVCILPREVSTESMPELGTTSTRTISPGPTVQTPREELDPDSGNLAELFNRENGRSSELNRETRSCFIGNSLSNCHYLIRQESPDTGSNGTYHFGNGQFHHKNTSYNLHRVAPEVLELPDKKLADTLVEAYFDRINCCWPIVDEELFMAQYNDKGSQGPLPLALLNAVCLVGAHVLASQSSNMKSLQSAFFYRAKTLVECRFEQDRVVYVQVALLLTWYSDGLEEIVANAWHWIGFATRTATALGMHRDATNSNMQPVYKRAYTRLWWILFQFDTIASASSGRPQVMNLEDSDVPELQYSHFEGIPRAEPEFMIHQSKLCAIISRTIRKGWALRSSAENQMEAINEADKALADFMLQLPTNLHLKHSNLTNRQAILHLTYNNFVLLLHRPAPRPLPGGPDAEPYNDPVLCGDAIAEIGSIFETLLNQEALSSIWFYSNHVLFTAIIYAMNEFGSRKPLIAIKSRRLLKTLLSSLRGLTKSWRFAQSLLQLFEERFSRLEQCDGSRTRTNPLASQCSAGLGQQSSKASISGSNSNHRLFRYQGAEAASACNNVERQVPEDVNDEFTNAQFSNLVATPGPAAVGRNPEGNFDAIMDEFSLFDDFTLDFFLGETGGDEGLFM